MRSSSGKGFVLAHGGETFMVEMDDADPTFKEGCSIRPNDQVIVTGTVSRRDPSPRVIEAASVYLPNLNTYFYASPADEERGLALGPADDVQSPIAVTGVVEAVRGSKITLSVGNSTFSTDTRALPAAKMPTSIGVGDRLRVSGELAPGSGEMRLVPSQVTRLRSLRPN
ncbi:hypothetical protein E2493_14330 [Sphingomonas parva]|uniref:DUF5666 domain-containing protein n=1 Tax=Sphingomonas parva TaxID=2555898 RepID=A0A4Y8ZQZ7_9SPHN|nr:hypothetical protein [Sphingomonas parva]TFI57545.1 hypothetical protein E2493_14330 [Sphingomonas parva]